MSSGMKPQDKDPNQGEGDKVSARHYNEEAEAFVAKARHGPKPTKVSVSELIAKGRTVIDRVRPIARRVVDRVKSRFNK